MVENEEKIETKEAESFSDKLKNYIKNLLDFSEFDTKTILYIIVFIGLFIVSLGLLYYIYFVDETFLYRLVVEIFVNPIYSLGFWGIFLFIAIMAIQGLLVPIPSEIVLLAAGMIWGFWIGGIMGVIGSLAAGILCFYISRRGGRPMAEKFVGETLINSLDDLIERYGSGFILIARFLPFVAFDPISYTAGITNIEFKKYTLATGVGSVPRAFFYSWLGASLNINPPVNVSDIDPDQFEAQAQFFNNVLLIILVVMIIMFGCYYLYMRKLEKDKK